MTRLLVISILGTPDLVRPGLFDEHPDGPHDAAWLCRRLEEAGAGLPADLVRVDVCIGETLPAHDEVDVVVVGGSYHNANEGHDWQLDTIEWLRGWRHRGKPFLGICGGHQMASVALGGRVSRMAVGPWAGTEPVALTDAGRDHYLFEGVFRLPPRCDHPYPDRPHTQANRSAEDFLIAFPLNWLQNMIFRNYG